MSGTTSVPQIAITPAGVVAPAESAILTGVLADINAAFGGNLNTDLTTPQGQLASSEAAIIGDVNAQFLYYVNQIDPAYAEGRMQDAIGRIYLMTRNAATSTAVTATCTGLAGTVIPVGAIAAATDGNTYLCTKAGTISTGGTVALPFACLATGPITCPAGTLTSIYQAIPGWDAITNAADGVTGTNVETRAAFEARRQASVAVNGQNTLANIKAAVLAVPNVLDCYAVENTSGTSATIGGVSVGANSIYVSVSGGAAAAIGQAIWTKKSLGCGTTGSTAVTVTDTSYSTPQPSYTINFTVPTSTAIYVAVSIVNSSSVPSNALALAQAAIISAFAGTDGGTRAKIGATFYASRLYADIAALGAWAQIISIYVGTSASPTGNTVALNINQVPTITASQITLTLV